MTCLKNKNKKTQMDPARLSVSNVHGQIIFSGTGTAGRDYASAPTPINIKGDISKEQICALIEKYTDAKCA